MIRSLCLSLLVLCQFAGMSMAQEKDEKWMDLENCDFCKQFAAQKELMQHMQWETHIIENGFLSIYVIPDEYKPAMKEMEEGMDKTVMKIQQGEQVTMCPHCQAYGEFMMSGCKMEELDTVGGQISMVTSSDPDMIAKLHAHARKTQEANKAIQKAMKHDHGHDHDNGHDHDHGHDHKGDHKHEHGKKDG